FDLCRRRHAVAAALRLPRKTEAHSANESPLAKCFLVYAERFEPAEKRLPCGPRERPSELALARPGRLPGEINFRNQRVVRHDRPDHARAFPAREHFGYMRVDRRQ